MYLWNETTKELDIKKLELFRVLAWSLCNNRRGVLWNQVRKEPKCIIDQVVGLLEKARLVAFMGRLSYPVLIEQVRWCPPTHRWLKLHTDGIVF